MSNRYTAKVSESLKLRGWIDEIQAKALRADNARLKGEVEALSNELVNQKIELGKVLMKSITIEDHQSTLATYKAAVVEARALLNQRFTLDVNLEWLQRQEILLHTLSTLTGDTNPKSTKKPFPLM